MVGDHKSFSGFLIMKPAVKSLSLFCYLTIKKNCHSVICHKDAEKTTQK